MTKSSFRGEARRAQHAHRVFLEARHRVADHPQHARLEIRDTGAEIQHAVGVGIVVQAVDAEVAPQRVFLDVAEDVVAQQHARFGVRGTAFEGLLVLAVGLEIRAVMTAEGRHLDHLASRAHVHDLEAPSDDPRAAEDVADLLGRGVGRDVEVLGLVAEQQVAHAAADEVCLEAGLAQFAVDPHCLGRDRLRRDVVLARSVAPAADVQRLVWIDGDGGVVQLDTLPCRIRTGREFSTGRRSWIDGRDVRILRIPKTARGSMCLPRTGLNPS